MKKILSIASVALMTMMMTSCGSKLCYCYTPDASGVYETEMYISPDLPCNSQNMSNRTCVEQNERMDPGEIAYFPSPEV